MNETSGGTQWFEASARARIEARGPEAARFVNNLCSNDVLRLADGAACEACFCNAKGGMVGYGTIRKLGDVLTIDTEPAQGAALLKHLDRYLIRERVVLADRTAETRAFHVFGPDAERRCAGMPGAAFYARQRTPQSGYDVLAPADQAAALRTALGAGEISAATATALRVAAGLPAFGIDVPEGTLPQELDRTSQAISFTKGCYIGQETVARLDAYGHVNKILRGLILAGPATTGEAIVQGEKEVGKLGTAARQPDGRWFGLAIVRVAAAAPGTAVMVGGQTAEISALPFAAGG